MKTLIDYRTVRDQHGEIQTSQTVEWFPWGTSSNGTAGADLGDGRYKGIIDPTANNAKIARYYDIKLNGVLKEEKVHIGEWVWWARSTTTVEGVSVTTSPQSFLFANLYDENDDALPTNIPNARVEVDSIAKGRLFFITAFSDTGFTIQAAQIGDDPPAGDLPINVKIKITIAEA